MLIANNNSTTKQVEYLYTTSNCIYCNHCSFHRYNVTQREPVAEEHSITIDLETLNQHESIQLFSKLSILSAII